MVVALSVLTTDQPLDLLAVVWLGVQYRLTTAVGDGWLNGWVP